MKQNFVVVRLKVLLVHDANSFLKVLLLTLSDRAALIKGKVCKKKGKFQKLFQSEQAVSVLSLQKKCKEVEILESAKRC